MYHSEKRSLYRFLSIYLLSTFLLFAIGASIFYTLEKHHLIDKQRQQLKQEGEYIHHQLILLHKTFSDTLRLKLHTPYKTALLDMDKKPLASNLPLPTSFQLHKEYQIDNNTLFYTRKIEPYYLGVVYIVLTAPLDEAAIVNLRESILLFMVAAGIFFVILGYFLGRLFIAPMRDAIGMMNRFIQDTTHELNTPVSTILTNLELIQTLNKCNRAKEEMQRIEIASKTISRIYDDLTYLKLNHAYHRDIRPLNISVLLQERIAYFSAAILAKQLQLQTKIADDVVVPLDQDDALRLIDNLLSNAIKYNRTGGNLLITLSNEALRIVDSGEGMDEKTLGRVHQRFERANSSEGGFGIGLDIVHQVVKHYRFKITFRSKRHEGTEVIIAWSRA
ncbi:Two-component system histidine kinase DccS [hydrothermal vent metagenome]|uniref:histidine kinase n=1 Tax=hydrothermal vent metagenome TaxID=652676 RepID=A0A1W1E712_9ZZZZ